MTDGIILQARTGSTRLQNKMLMPFYRGRSVLQLLLEDTRRMWPHKTIVLATTTRTPDDALAHMAEGAGVHCFRGDEDDVLGRFIGAARTYAIERLVRVCADNPFLLPRSFKALFDNALPTHDYVAYAFADGRPTIKSHLGFFAELTTLAALERVAAATTEKLYREHVTNYLYTHPANFNLHLLPLPAVLEGRTDLRFTLDTRADFDLLQEIYTRHREETDGSLEALVALADSNPEYLHRMQNNIAANEK